MLLEEFIDETPKIQYQSVKEYKDIEQYNKPVPRCPNSEGNIILIYIRPEYRNSRKLNATVLQCTNRHTGTSYSSIIFNSKKYYSLSLFKIPIKGIILRIFPRSSPHVRNTKRSAISGAQKLLQYSSLALNIYLPQRYLV